MRSFWLHFGGEKAKNRFKNEVEKKEAKKHDKKECGRALMEHWGNRSATYAGPVGRGKGRVRS